MQPILDRWLYLQDTCGVHNLHGLPGVFSGLASALAASAAEEMGGRNKAAYGNRWNTFEDHTMLLDQDNEWDWDDCIYINLWSGYGAYVCNLIYALYFQLCLLVDTKLCKQKDEPCPLADGCSSRHLKKAHVQYYMCITTKRLYIAQYLQL